MLDGNLEVRIPESVIPIEYAQAFRFKCACELFEVTFSAKPKFEALSYMWGEGPAECSIVMNSMDFSIRRISQGVPIPNTGWLPNELSSPQDGRQVKQAGPIHDGTVQRFLSQAWPENPRPQAWPGLETTVPATKIDVHRTTNCPAGQFLTHFVNLQT